MSVRIGIIDDHPITMRGVEAVLGAEADLHVVASAETVAELLSSGEGFDVILLDLMLADGSSPAINLQRLAGASDARVIAFTSGDRPQAIREAARGGAIGMIRKSVPSRVLIEAVRAAAKGEVIASADWAAALELDAGLRTRLTTRETEVLALYASGETAERVGKQLFISRETVIDHIRKIRAKYAALDRPAENKLALYHRAVEDGIIDPQ